MPAQGFPAHSFSIHSFFLACFSLSVLVQAGIAIPQPSQVANSFYIPAYDCPAAETWPYGGVWNAVNIADSSKSGVLECDYDTLTPCFYDQQDGSLDPMSAKGCPLGNATAISPTACDWRCSDYTTDDLNILSSLSAPWDGLLFCTYGVIGQNSNAGYCAYDLSDGALRVLQSAAALVPVCPSRASSVCTQQRRQYRREDNLTASLRKKNLHVRVAPPVTT
uniref:Uncharacterized protein n=1 Tax=Mycena chlorophos TaxID=658473 RepID=A0ABQ0LX72_MYCCL|nr:predicted protein [Mycena chlorophos]